MRKYYSEEELSQLKKDADFWRNISRGFYADPHGNDFVNINGRKIVGYWVYGYFIHGTDGKPCIVGSPKLNYISATKKYEIIPDTHTRCTGFMNRTNKGEMTPIFQYDVVDCHMEKTTAKKLTVCWDALQMDWALCDFSTEKAKSIAMKSFWGYDIVGNAFNIELF